MFLTPDAAANVLSRYSTPSSVRMLCFQFFLGWMCKTTCQSSIVAQAHARPKSYITTLSEPQHSHGHHEGRAVQASRPNKGSETSNIAIKALCAPAEEDAHNTLICVVVSQVHK